MRIIKYKKTGKNKYNILFDNNKSITLYEDIILKYELLLKKEIKDLDAILLDNKNYEAYDKALSYIKIKMRCESEIRTYLLKNNYNEKLIDEVILKLKNNNLLNEELYIKAYTYDKFNINNYGPKKIINELIKLGLDENNIYKYSVIDEELLYDKLDKLIEKKIKQFKNYTGDVLKYKIESYFVNLGYEKEMISEILSNKDTSSNDYEKEYQKLYAKYSKKYSGFELDMRIKQKLMAKGYRK